MATKNIVPRSDKEGALGTASKMWGAVRAFAIYLNGVALGTAATKDVGTGSTNVAAGDHAHSGVYEPADADIAKVDTIGTWTKPQKITQATLTSSGGAVNLALGTAAAYYFPLTEDTTFGQPTGFPTGRDIIPFTIDFVQHASAAKTVTLNATYFKTPGGAAFSMPSGLSSRTRIHCFAMPEGYVDVVDVKNFS